MDSDMQAKLEALGAGFENVVKEKFLAIDPKGKSEVEGSAGIFGKTRSVACLHCHVYYSEERKKAEAILKEIENGVENKLRIWGQSS